MLKQNSLVFLTTYPPRECGIATFSFDLIKAIKLVSTGTRIKVAALNMTAVESKRYPPEVAWQLNQEDPQDYHNLALEINADNSITSVIIQHEYGIFGDNWGINILTFIETLKKPFIIALHTVWENPPGEMLHITKKIVEKASKVVVMSNLSKDILSKVYPHIDPNKIKFIPHGIHPVLYRSANAVKPRLGLNNRTVLTTFGLLSRNKGIEFVLRALPSIVAKHPEIIYLILGGTHPVVRRKEGESYRIELLKLTEELGLKRHVRFYDQYFPLEVILKYLQATDIYLFTALDPKQSVSGTFSYALGTGRAVVSTSFNQAKELISPTIGRLVPMRDSAAFSSAILGLLEDPLRLEKMNDHAYLSTRSMVWTNVAEEYLHLIAPFLLPPINLQHLNHMVDNFGLVQFARGSMPDYDSGYTLDDNARALIVCHWIGELYPELKPKMDEYISIFTKFIDTCLLKNNTFINYIAKDQRTFTSQNNAENLNDSIGRVMWAAATSKRSDALLQKSIKLTEKAVYPRSIAMSIFGLFKLNDRTTISKFADQLVESFDKNADGSWHWFEPELTYANGLLPASLFSASMVTHDEKYKQIAIKTLEFLISTCFYGDIYVPIGQKKWYVKGTERGMFDAQPEDPFSMLMALEMGYDSTHDPRYARYARKCFSWYRGNNLLGLRMYDPISGGCYDGLTSTGVNRNQGAESLISYLMSRCIIDRINHKVTVHGK